MNNSRLASWLVIFSLTVPLLWRIAIAAEETSIEVRGTKKIAQSDKACSSVLWSPDDKWIAYLQHKPTDRPYDLASEVWVIKANGKENHRIGEARAISSWLPAADRIAVTPVQGKRVPLEILDVKTGELCPIPRVEKGAVAPKVPTGMRVSLHSLEDFRIWMIKDFPLNSDRGYDDRVKNFVEKNGFRFPHLPKSELSLKPFFAMLTPSGKNFLALVEGKKAGTFDLVAFSGDLQGKVTTLVRDCTAYDHASHPSDGFNPVNRPMLSHDGKRIAFARGRSIFVLTLQNTL